jgi:hypothetical protein
MRFIISYIVLIAFDATKIRRIKQDLVYIYIHILLSTLPYQGFSVTGYIRADRGRLWAYKGRFKQPLLVRTSIMICPLTYVPNPPCQLSLWEETGVPGENPRLSAERWLLLFHMRTGFESHWESSHWGLNLRPQRWKASACANHLATEAPCILITVFWTRRLDDFI